MDTLDHYYKILGIKPSSSLLEINQAYIRAINLLLPHRTSTDPDVQKKAQAQAKEINEAYEKIKKVYNPSMETYGSVGTADAPLPPLQHKPLPPATANATFDMAAALKAAVEKAAADRVKADKAAEEKAFAEKAAAVVAATHTTAAAISAAVFAATDRETMARVAAAKAATHRAECLMGSAPRNPSFYDYSGVKCFVAN